MRYRPHDLPYSIVRRFALQYSMLLNIPWPEGTANPHQKLFVVSSDVLSYDIRGRKKRAHLISDV